MSTTHERDERFEVLGGHLVRKVVPRRGKPYEHRCPLASFERVAHAIDETGDDGFTLESLVEVEDLPFKQVAVALDQARLGTAGSRPTALNCLTL